MKQQRFKFKVFDKTKKKWYYDTQQLDFEIVFGNDNLELVQPIGWEDKNGKLIYESDIVLVKEHCHDEEKKYIVEWSDDNAGFCLRSQEPNHPDCDIYGGFHNLESIEIIGNVYDNEDDINLI